MKIKRTLVNIIKSTLTPQVYARWHIYKNDGQFVFETCRPFADGVAAARRSKEFFEKKYNLYFTEEELERMSKNKSPIYTLRSWYKDSEFADPIIHLLTKYLEKL